MLLPFFCSAQNQGNIWYFGGNYSNQSLSGVGIDFNGTSPVILSNSGMTYTEGAAAYCNSVGELLFYAKGDVVYDKTHNIMSNGSGLGGHWSTEQSALIVPVTGDTNKYYIFNNDGVSTSNGTGLFYSLIDMQHNGNLGAVTEPKAANLLSGTSEQLTGCKHSNGNDFWVIVTDHDSCIFYAYQITPSGVMPPVITNLGFNTTVIGTIEISPNADKVALKIRTSVSHLRHLIDFNNTTGTFSNPQTVGNPTGWNTACGFSPNGNLFYDIEKNNNRDSIYQYDLTASNIAASKLLVYSRTAKTQLDSRIGPDGKLYFGGDFYSPALDAITSPNTVGAACNFQPSALPLAGMSPGIMLPNELLVAPISPIIPNSVNEYSQKNNISIYPNPTNARLTIKITNSSFSVEDKLQLFSIIGQQLYTAPLNSQQTILDLTNYPKGTYILATSINGLQQSYKILKE